MNRKTVLISFIQLLGTFLVMGIVVYAWFTMTDETDTGVVATLPSLDLVLDYYVYRDNDCQGADQTTLQNNLCVLSEDLDCYEHITDLSTATLIDPGRRLFPNDRLSFAIKITNLSDVSGIMTLSLSELVTTGFILPQNKVQIAFAYYVTKIVYVNNGVEGSDVKDNGTIVYTSGAGEIYTHFSILDNQRYLLASQIAVSHIPNDNQIVIVFFDLYFDPWVGTFDTLGNPIDNSNAFQNQVFTIDKLFVQLIPE